MDGLKKEIKRLIPAILGCAVALIIGELLGFALEFSPYLFPNADVRAVIELEILLKGISLVLTIGAIVGFFVLLLLLLAFIRHGKVNEATTDPVTFTDESPEEFDDVEKVETDDKDDPEELE